MSQWLRRLGLILGLGLWLAGTVWVVWVLVPSTLVAADFHVYQRASESLYEIGDPYAVNDGVYFEFHYRYPPLLAMLMPALPSFIWFPLLALAWSVPMWFRWKQGRTALLLPVLLAGAWLQTLVNGNAAGFIVAALALVPVYRRGGAVAAAAASWIKLHPIFVILWYLGRRDWIALRWFFIAFVGLGVVQLPWLPGFVTYAMSQQAEVPAQFALRGAGPWVWGIGVAILAFLTVRFAREQRGWLYAVLVQIAALPRVNLITAPLLLAARPTPPLLSATPGSAPRGSVDGG